MIKLTRNKNEAVLPQALVNRIQKVVDNASDEMASENYAAGLKLFEKAWEMLPEPKVNWDYAVSLLGDLCQAHIEAGMLTKAKKWHSLLLKSPYTDIDVQPFALGAEIYFGLGKLEDALQLLGILEKMGGARAMKTVPKDVRDFYLQHSRTSGKA